MVGALVQTYGFRSSRNSVASREKRTWFLARLSIEAVYHGEQHSTDAEDRNYK